MNFSFRVAIVAILALCSLPTRSDADVCTSAGDCNAKGLKAMAAKDHAAAETFFLAEVGYAEDSASRSQELRAYNNLALAYLQSKDYKSAWMWAQNALTVSPNDVQANRYLGAIEGSHALTQSGEMVSGLYAKYAGRTYWNTLRVFDNNGSIGFRLKLYRIGPSWRQYGPAQIGDASGTLARRSTNRFTYNGDPDFPSSSISFWFLPTGVTLRQRGDCGFGYELEATGSFRRISIAN